MTDRDVIQAAFTELASHYEASMDAELRGFLGQGYEEFVERFIAMAAIGEGEAVLDVATGTALIPRKLANRMGVGGKVVGLDLTPAMLKQGQVRIRMTGSPSSIHLVCGSAMAMPFDQDVFDTVLCGFGMHHMGVHQLLAETRRVLKTRGKLLMAGVGVPRFWRSALGRIWVKVLLALYRRILGEVRGRAETEAFKNIRTASEWCTALSEQGFTEIEVDESRTRRPWLPHALTMKAVAG
jgi:ubiquinone/menaquinone biosynthesis C-methylase UbiE